MATQSNKANKAKTVKTAPMPPAKAPAPAKPAKAAPAGASYQPTQEEIQTRAFEIYVAEGCREGSDLENWLRAEQELRARGSR
jgi:hypothetical protein